MGRPVFRPTVHCGAHSYDSDRWQIKCNVESPNRFSHSPEPGRFSVSRCNRRPSSPLPPSAQRVPYVHRTPTPECTSFVLLRSGYTNWYKTAPIGQGRTESVRKPTLAGHAHPPAPRGHPSHHPSRCATPEVAPAELPPMCQYPATTYLSSGNPSGPKPSTLYNAAPVQSQKAAQLERRASDLMEREAAQQSGWTTKMERKASNLMDSTPSLAVSRPLDGPFLLSLNDLERAQATRSTGVVQPSTVPPPVWAPYVKGTYKTSEGSKWPRGSSHYRVNDFV